MPKGPKLSEQERGQIRAYKEEGHSNRWIARKIGRDSRVIDRFVKNPDTYGTAKSPGRPQKLTARAKRRILAEISNSTEGVRKIRDRLVPEVSKSTVHNVIKASPNIVRQRMHRHPQLKEEHKMARNAFAELHVPNTLQWRHVCRGILVAESEPLL